MHKTVDDKIDQWFEDRGIVANGKTMSQAIKTLEETTELIDAINTNNLLEIVDAVGDIYVTLRGVCVVQGIDLTECAELAYNEIKDRKGQLRADGTFVKEHDRLPEKLTSGESYTPHPGPLNGKKFTQRQFDEVAEKVDETEARAADAAFIRHTEAMEESRSKAGQDDVEFNGPFGMDEKKYTHTKEYFDRNRNRPMEGEDLPITEGLYERSMKDKYGRAVLSVSQQMQEELEPLPDLIYTKDKVTGRTKQMSAKEYWDSLPNTVASKDIPTRTVWRTDPNDPKIIPFEQDDYNHGE